MFDVFAILDILTRHGKSSKKTNEQANLAHSTCICYPAMGTFFHNILFAISLLIFSTQIAASRRKNLKSDVWKLWLEIAIWSLSHKGKLDFSILPMDVICLMGTFL